MNERHISFDELPGRELIRLPESRDAAKAWLQLVQVELRVPAQVHLYGPIRMACLHSVYDLDEQRIVEENETAYAVRMQSGRIVCGVAPTPRSASTRARKLLIQGHCRAAGVAPLGKRSDQSKAASV